MEKHPRNPQPSKTILLFVCGFFLFDSNACWDTLSLTACPTEQFKADAPTRTSDRQQGNSSIANSTAAQFESVAATDTSDRPYQSLTACTTEQFKADAPTRTSDRQCQTLTACGTGLRLQRQYVLLTSSKQLQPQVPATSNARP